MRDEHARGLRASVLRSAFSFVEVLVATALVVAILLPILVVFTLANRTSEVSLDEIAATNWASEIVEQLKVLPSSAGFRFMVQTPVPNLPPKFPDWTNVSGTGITFGEANPNVPARLPNLDARGWVAFGYPYWMGPGDDSLQQARSRLWLSPMPNSYRRKLKLYHPLANPDGVIDPNLWQAMVRIEWDRTFLGTPTQSRWSEMGTLIANPTFSN